AAGDDTNAAQERRAIFPIAPAIRAARPSISRWCGARTPARYGLAVRLLQPEIMAIGHERERSGAAEPRAARRGDDPRRLSALRQGVVALHAQQRAVPGYVFRFSGPVSCSARCPRMGSQLLRPLPTEAGFIRLRPTSNAEVGQARVRCPR